MEIKGMKMNKKWKQTNMIENEKTGKRKEWE